MGLMSYLVRDAEEPRLDSTLPAPRGAQADQVEDPGPVTGREWWGYGVWGMLAIGFLVFELSALDADTRWPTLSTTAANLQREHPWTAMVILGGLAILTVRIIAHPWPNRKLDD